VYAATYPDRLRGLVLADTFSPDLAGWSEWLQRSAVLRATVPPVRLLGYERVERAMVWLQQRLHGESVSGDYDKIEQLRAAGPKMTTAEFAKVVRAVAAFHRTSVDLAAISVPTLVLYGEHEPPFIKRHAPIFESEIPDASMLQVPGRATLRTSTTPSSSRRRSGSSSRTSTRTPRRPQSARGRVRGSKSSPRASAQSGAQMG